MHNAEHDGSSPSSAPPTPRDRTGALALQRSDSCGAAWAELDSSSFIDETVAEAFAVVGLPPRSVLEPLNVSLHDDVVLANLCVVSAAEPCPAGFEVLSETPCARSAALNVASGTAASGSRPLFLAQRLAARRDCARPITAVRLVDTDRGEEPPTGFESVGLSAASERSPLARSIWVSRAVSDPRDTSTNAAPIGGMLVVARERGHVVSVPAGFLLLDGVLGSSRAERCLALCRSSPTGLLQVPLKANILDSLLREDRPGRAQYGGASAYGAATPHTAGGTPAVPAASESATAARGIEQPASQQQPALPSALPHFCLPQGCQLRVECPWPTAHEFALTDRLGVRLYGCCLVVWEPLDEHSLLVLRPSTTDERLRSERANRVGASRRRMPMSALWDASRQEWCLRGEGSGGASEMAHEVLQAAFGAPHRVMLVPAATADSVDSIEEVERSLEEDAPPACEADGIGQVTCSGGRDREGGDARGAMEGAEASQSSQMRQRFVATLVVQGLGLYTPTSLCILSRHPFLSSLRLWLCELYRHSLTRATLPIERLIGGLLWECPLPRPTVSVRLTLGREQICFARPAPASELPVNELRLSSLVDSMHHCDILKLFAAACVEVKIIFVSAYPSQLTAAAEALLSLLWPLQWLNVYIPLLPLSLIDVLGSPVPYLLGMHVETFEAAIAAGVLPDDVVIARLDQRKLVVPEALAEPVPSLPDAAILVTALDQFSRMCPAAADAAAQADLAFPLREAGSAATARAAERRERAQRLARHAFASWWAKLLAGYQDYLRTAGAEVHQGSVDAVLHAQGLIASREPQMRQLLSRMLQTQGLVRMLEQRAGFSTRDAEFVLFDTLADQYRAGALRGPFRAGVLPLLPSPLPSRVYSVPPPLPPPPPPPDQAASMLDARDEGSGLEDGVTDDVAGAFGPYICWPRLDRTRMSVPRPIPPLNFEEAPPTHRAPTCTQRSMSAQESAIATPAPGITSAVTLLEDATAGTPRASPRSRPTHRRSATAPGSTFHGSMGAALKGMGFLGRRGGAPRSPPPKSTHTTPEGTPEKPHASRLALGSGASHGARVSCRSINFTDAFGGSSKRNPAPSLEPVQAAPAAWARERLGEIVASALLCHALCIPHHDVPAAAVDTALAQLEDFCSLGVVPPQCAYHAMLRACSRAGLPEHSRLLFEQLQRAGRRPDAQTIGWLSHALIESSCRSPEVMGMAFGRSPEASTIAWDEGDVAGGGGMVEDGGCNDANELCGTRATIDESTSDSERPATRSALRRSFGGGILLQTTASLSRSTSRAASSEEDRTATLSLENTCATCGTLLRATDTIGGWYARSLQQGHEYGCECPRCSSPWQPMLRVHLQNTAEPSERSVAAASAQASSSVASSAEAIAGTSSGVDMSGDGLIVEYPLLSPTTLLRELEALLENSRDRSTLRCGWSRARHLFPSVFWTLCWHAARPGFLPSLLPQFELEPLPEPPGGEAMSPPGRDMHPPLVLMHSVPDGHGLAPSIDTREDESCRARGDHYSPVGSDTTIGGVDYQGWVRGGHFVLQRTSAREPGPPHTPLPRAKGYTGRSGFDTDAAAQPHATRTPET